MTDGYPRMEVCASAVRDIGGMVYVGRGPRKRRGGDPDNAFIDSSKNVTRRGGDYEGQGMDYWPNYSTIDSRSCATYLDWLSSGRSDTRYDVGYVFLFTSTDSNGESLSTRQMHRNAATSSLRCADYLRYTAITTRYVVTLVPSSMRQASWTRATSPNLSSSTMVTRCQRRFCLQSVGWRHAANR